MGKLEPINNPDLKNTSKKYWNRVLRSHGLSERRGESPQQWFDRGTDKERREAVTTEIGGVTELVGMEEEELRKSTGKVYPEGRGPRI